MTALLYIIAICGFTLAACALAWVYERDLDAEAEQIAADNEWPPSETPIHDALLLERWHQQLADDDLIRKAEQWGESA